MALVLTVDFQANAHLIDIQNILHAPACDFVKQFVRQGR
jgi:hypothetical protein